MEEPVSILIGEDESAKLLYELSQHPGFMVLGAVLNSLPNEVLAGPPKNVETKIAWETRAHWRDCLERAEQRISELVAEGKKLTQLEKIGAKQDAEDDRSNGTRRRA